MSMWQELGLILFIFCYLLLGVGFFYSQILCDADFGYKKGDSITLWCLLLAVALSFGPLVWIIILFVKLIDDRRNK